MSFKGRIWSQVFVFVCFATWSIVNIWGGQYSVHRLYWDIALWLVFSIFVWPLASTYDRMTFLAHHDVVTGVFNRHFAMEKLPQLMLKASRRRESLSFFLLDGNGLKLLNDTFGHAYGDKAIQEIVNILQLIFRTNGLLIRMGGDEFLCVAPRMAMSEAMYFVELLEKSIVNATRRDDHAISVSAGYAVYPDDGEELPILLEIADQRMYARKNMAYGKTFDRDECSEQSESTDQ